MIKYLFNNALNQNCSQSKMKFGGKVFRKNTIQANATRCGVALLVLCIKISGIVDWV